MCAFRLLQQCLSRNSVGGVCISGTLRGTISKFGAPDVATIRPCGFSHCWLRLACLPWLSVGNGRRSNQDGWVAGSPGARPVVGECISPIVWHARTDCEVRGLKDWVVLILDSGGGAEGMHLSMEFALLMYHHQIEVFNLPEYHTKAMMPLDRAPHRAMELAWGELRRQFVLTHGHGVASQFQALPLIKEAWERGVLPTNVASGWKDTGIYPWDPEEVLTNQRMKVFRNDTPKAEIPAFSDHASSKVLQLPKAACGKPVRCGTCQSALPVSYKFCMECGTPSPGFEPQAAVAMKAGHRVGYKRVRPKDFDVEALVESHFDGLKAATPTGEVHMSAVSADTCAPKPVPEPSSSSSSDAEVEAPKYDPPVLVAAQLKTPASIRKAWVAALSDVADAKHKDAFIAWLPGWLKTVHTSEPKMVKELCGTTKDLSVFVRALYTKVCGYTPETRKQWFDKRVAMMKKLEK